MYVVLLASRARATPVLTTICPLVVRLFLGVGRAHGPENACLGRIIPPLLPVAHHLLRLRVPQYLATPCFHASSRR